jgi:hypothetical protein
VEDGSVGWRVVLLGIGEQGEVCPCGEWGRGGWGNKGTRFFCNSVHVVLANWFSFLPLGPFAPITWFCSYFLHVIVEVINISHIASHDIKHTIHT